MTAERKLLNPVSKSRLHEEIVGQIQRKIVIGELTAGEKLPAERELADSLNVNRATVREALKKLEMLDLVEIRHGDGIYIKNYLESGNLELLKKIIYMDGYISLDILKNLLYIRKILVPEMSGVAAENRSDAELRELEEIVSDNSIPIVDRDIAVHSIIARASKNVLFVFILNFFNQLIRDFGDLYFLDKKNVRASEKFHREILEAVKDRDSGRARKVMRDVLIYTEEEIFKNYSSVAGEKTKIPDRGR